MATKVGSKLPRAAAGHDSVWQGILSEAERRRLGSGDQLPSVRELAERLDVKPTLVRDALLQAQARGVVKIVPRIGAFLQTTSPAARALTGPLESASQAALKTALECDPHNLLHLLDARRLVEVELIGRAAERRRVEELLPARQALEAILHLPPDAPRPDYVEPDIQFHTELSRLAGNGVLAGIQQTLMELLRPYLLDVPPTVERRMLADRSHAAIYAAVAEGNAERARHEMNAHLSLAYDSLLRDLERPPMLDGEGAL